jgi:hypothetical protein
MLQCQAIAYSVSSQQCVLSWVTYGATCIPDLHTPNGHIVSKWFQIDKRKSIIRTCQLSISHYVWRMQHTGTTRACWHSATPNGSIVWNRKIGENSNTKASLQVVSTWRNWQLVIVHTFASSYRYTQSVFSRKHIPSALYSSFCFSHKFDVLTFFLKTITIISLVPTLGSYPYRPKIF